ncbi:unnamed protein product [Clavelina lepadiformis]|uniref:C3H1-type domain-containing protein n=1 Tax=Clavelina lepadiformis TaxID=159417 RepID=A0ABP0FE33_CLALP
MATTPPQSEKPFHYTYLKEFRVNQCPLFLQHKCTQHRPFTCFHWHFSNQRRRRPLRKRDGTFNYSADVYCSKYDETTGICPDGDECPYIHRNTGDTERRYHLRYYKTGTCIHETDSRGNCVKNGPHCAFAHGAHDLRPPVYDIREQQGLESSSASSFDQIKPETVNLAEKIVNEDPKWQDANYVLANYKTEWCKRPPRLCRQGYACPQYHNTKDRRRNPKKFKYRSSPCPTVKQGDDWKDPSCCEKGDNCLFCHTRTEQQFHPEIYKSTKCHDMVQSGYCPRGPFCAFAHVEQEIRIVEDPAPASGLVGSFNQLTTDNNFGSFSEAVDHGKSISVETHHLDQSTLLNNHQAWTGLTNSLHDNSEILTRNASKSLPPCPSPISKPVMGSLGNGKSLGVTAYSKAPGSERSSVSDQASFGNSHGFGSIGSNTPWPGMTVTQTTNMIGSFSSTNSSPPNLLPKHFNSLNSDAPPFYPPDETVDSVVDNALKDVDDSYRQEKSDDKNMTVRMWSHSKSASHDSNMGSTLFPMSDPVNIPQDQMMRNTVHAGLSSVSPPLLGNAVNFPSAGSSLPGGRFPSMPHSSNFHIPGGQSGSLGSGMVSIVELERMQQKCKQWQDSWNQAKAACDAWKREATDANERARLSEERGKMAAERCHLLESKLTSADIAGDGDASCKFLHQHYEFDELKKFPVAKLKQLQTKYKADLEILEKLIWELLWQPQK